MSSQHVFPGEKGGGTFVPSQFRPDLMVFELHPVLAEIIELNPEPG